MQTPGLHWHGFLLLSLLPHWKISFAENTKPNNFNDSLLCKNEVILPSRQLKGTFKALSLSWILSIQSWPTYSPIYSKASSPQVPAARHRVHPARQEQRSRLVSSGSRLQKPGNGSQLASADLSAAGTRGLRTLSIPPSAPLQGNC